MNIERAKELFKMRIETEEYSGMTTNTLKEAMTTVLSELEKKDKEVENLKKQIPSIENGTYTGDCEGLLKIEQEVIKKDKVINEMAKEITEFTGNCPYDKYDWQDIDCEKVCEDNMKQCWVEYFTNKVEREGK